MNRISTDNYPLLKAFADALKLTILEEIDVEGKCKILQGECKCPKCQIANMPTEDLINDSVDRYGKSFNWRKL